LHKTLPEVGYALKTKLLWRCEKRKELFEKYGVSDFGWSKESLVLPIMWVTGNLSWLSWWAWSSANPLWMLR